METIRDGVRINPSLYPQNLDLVRQAILFLMLDQPTLRAASFLDDRILDPQLQGRWVRFDEIDASFPALPPQRPLHFIFHSGHVGSTLVSRLLDDIDGVLGLREPLPLRVLANAMGDLAAPHALIGSQAWGAQLRLLLACWGRGYAETRCVVVKGTSIASQCSEAIAQASPQSRMLCLNLQPEPYLATLLAGANSWLDLRGQAQERMKRLLAIAPWHGAPLHTLGLGEVAAMTWTVETLTHRAAARNVGDRMMLIDFDALLAAPDVALRDICGHLRIEAPDSYFSGVNRSATMARYSKAPDQAFTPVLRREILAASRVQNAEEIGKGMRWIEAFAAHNADLASAL